MKPFRFVGAAALLILTATWWSSGQTIPAPTVDRVGFPAGYQTTFTKLVTVDQEPPLPVRVNRHRVFRGGDGRASEGSAWLTSPPDE